MNRPLSSLLVVALGTLATAALAAPTTYNIDPKHTYPSFEADHFSGVSVWRGKFNSTSGTVVVDREAKSGAVDITIDLTSVDTGLGDLNDHLKKADFFEVEKYPTATFKGKLAKFENGAPTEVQGELNLHGVTKPVTLVLTSFKCMPHPMKKKEFCGANATATINRDDFGIAWGKAFGFAMWVRLQIQVEAEISQ
jgi:polyisoprenoid-binding protein YceI